MYVIYKGHNLEFQAESWEAPETLLEQEKMPTQITEKRTQDEERQGLICYLCPLHQSCVHVCSGTSRSLSLAKHGRMLQ